MLICVENAKSMSLMRSIFKNYMKEGVPNDLILL
jgi:hypothetical protein